MPAILSPAGNIVGDLRRLDGRQHEFASPLPKIKVYAHAQMEITSANRTNDIFWHPLALLHSAAKGQVALGVRRKYPFDLFIIKTATKGISCTNDGRDSTHLLQTERDVLIELETKSFPCPRVVTYERGVHQDTLLTTDVGGNPVSHLPPAAQLERVPDILAIVQGLHDLGFIHRDLKPDNIIFSGKRLFLIDFELACRQNQKDAHRASTPGYTHPSDLSLSSRARDYYSLAFLIAQSLLETPATALPSDPKKLISTLKSRGNAPHARLITCLLEAYIEQKHLTLSQLSFNVGCEVSVLKIDPDLRRKPLPDRQEWRRKIVSDAESILLSEAKRDSCGVYWENRRPGEDLISSNLANGTAGVILALTIFDYVNRTEIHESTIFDAARWLCHRPVDPFSGGLFTGSAGIALILSVLAKRYSASILTEGSLRFFKGMSRGAEMDPDFYFGGAGMIYAASISTLALGDSRFLSFVSPIAKFLKNSVKRESGVLCWDSSQIVADRRNPCLGLAHGNIGTALSLAVYAKASGQTSYLDLAQETLLSTFNNGRDIHDYQIRIALNEDQAPDPPHFWCRGLGGLLWASLQVFEVNDDRFVDMRNWLANKIFLSDPGGNISYCHGLAGRLELLRMLKNIPQFAQRAAESISSVELYLRQSTACKDGRLTWHTEDIGQFSNELWLGGLSGATGIALLSAGCSMPLISPELFTIVANRDKTAEQESA